MYYTIRSSEHVLSSAQPAVMAPSSVPIIRCMGSWVREGVRVGVT